MSSSRAGPVLLSGCLGTAFILAFASHASAQLGLPLPHGSALGLDPAAPEITLDDYSAPHLESGPGYHFHGPGGLQRYYRYGFGYTPWARMFQTRKRKAHHPAIYETPRLGLQYNYPFAADYPPYSGLATPPDPETPMAHPRTDTYVAPPEPGSVARTLFKRGRYARAGQLLGEELKHSDVPLETYVLITELLVATGHHKDAARVLIHAIDFHDDLRALDDWNLADDFPSRAKFDSHMKALGAELYAKKNESVAFLDAMFRILSGDSNTGLDALVDLQESDRVGSVAKKAYMHFVGLRFEPTPVEKTTDEKAKAKKSNESL